MPQTYKLAQYYGRSNRIDSTTDSLFNANTIMLMFGRDSNNQILTLKDGLDQKILYSTNHLSSIEYAIKNELDPQYIYLSINDYPHINRYVSIELNQTVDIWMINQYTLEYTSGIPFIK